jgi:hypothetical protein
MGKHRLKASPKRLPHSNQSLDLPSNVKMGHWANKLPRWSRTPPPWFQFSPFPLICRRWFLTLLAQQARTQGVPNCRGLKKSEKELCNNTQFSPLENLDRRDRALPLFNGYYKQATPPKTATHAESLENSLNKNKELLQNGCKLFHLEYDPADNAQMDPV